VLAVASILSEPISEPLVVRALRPAPALASPVGSSTPTVSAIQQAVSLVFEVPPDELLSARRTPRVARARQVAMYLARELTSLSLAQIAREFNRDHSTVLHAIRSVSQRLEPGSETADAIHRVRLNLVDKTDAGG
jgi:chromosomal replication initiator protein